MSVSRVYVYWEGVWLSRFNSLWPDDAIWTPSQYKDRLIYVWLSMLKIRRPLGRLIFNMGIAIPGKTVFLIETAPWQQISGSTSFQAMACGLTALSLMGFCGIHRRAISMEILRISIFKASLGITLSNLPWTNELIAYRFSVTCRLGKDNPQH